MTKKKNPVPKNFQNNSQITTSKGYAKKEEMQVLEPIDSGAVGTAMRKIDKTVSDAATEPKENDKVAIHSTKNVYLPGVGKVLKGYNIVKREAAEKWLAREHIREATPEELAREFGL